MSIWNNRIKPHDLDPDPEQFDECPDDQEDLGSASVGSESPNPATRQAT